MSTQVSCVKTSEKDKQKTKKKKVNGEEKVSDCRSDRLFPRERNGEKEKEHFISFNLQFLQHGIWGIREGSRYFYFLFL